MKLCSFKLPAVDIRTLEVLAEHLDQTETEALRIALRLAVVQLAPNSVIRKPQSGDIFCAGRARDESVRSIRDPAR